MECLSEKLVCWRNIMRVLKEYDRTVKHWRNTVGSGEVYESYPKEIWRFMIRGKSLDKSQYPIATLKIVFKLLFQLKFAFR